MIKSALCGSENAAFLQSLLDDKFFSEICTFPVWKGKKWTGWLTLLRGMMLLDGRKQGEPYPSLSVWKVRKYAAHIKENYSEQQKEHLYDVIDYLEKAFSKREKRLNARTIPKLMLWADKAMGKGYSGVGNIYLVKPEIFRRKILKQLKM